MHKSVALIVTLIASATSAFQVAAADKEPKTKAHPVAEETAQGARKLLWEDAVNIASRDLYNGARGKEDTPGAGTVFTFEKEDLDGTNPKYLVRDDKGTKWKVKLGDEARPEPVASRIVWAAGYFVDENYFLPKIRVENIPADLKRGRKLIGPDGTMTGVRLKLESKKDRKKIGTWDWKTSPFAGTRELNGMRVMMALINNWDLKDVNNGVFEVKGSNGPEMIYEVTDLGASFGSPRFDTDYAHDKGDLKAYRKSAFIENIRDSEVDFGVPGKPSLPVIFNPAQFVKRQDLTWIGKHIPRADARWVGELLSKLSANQIEDAFRAGGYTAQEANEFTTIVQARIAQLRQL
jgi:hypothetical protein